MTADTKAPAQPALRSFRAGTQPTIRRPYATNTVAFGAVVPDVPVAPVTMLRCIYVEVSATAAGNAAAVAFNGDAPENVIASFAVKDAGGNPIFGPFNGYDVKVAQKYGGYSRNSDLRQSAVYFATTGAVGAGGSFNMVFRIPIEAVPRTGLGTLRAQSTQSPMVISCTLASSATVYSVAPTTVPSVNVTYNLGGYWKGSADSAGPKAFGSTQLWNKTQVLAVNGYSDLTLPNVGLGNYLRNYVFENYVPGGARQNPFAANTIEVKFRGQTLSLWNVNTWQHFMSEEYDLPGVIDAAAGRGLDTGVFVQPFDKDFGILPGAEAGTGYLKTEIGDQLELISTWTANTNLYLLVNHIAAASGADLSR